MKTRFHVIPHVHWDREWYFTQNKSTLYLLHDLTEIVEYLENNEDVTYYLFDAQTSLIDDYLRYMPQMNDRIRKLISEKRLLTGPWYTQTDQMIIHGESIVRNLLYGIKEAEDYGYCFRVGYAVDCFGQGNQMPQIYSGFGIPYTLFKRGVDFNKVPTTEFIWKSDDGSSVKAYHAIDYMNFRNPSASYDKNVETIRKIEDKYLPRSASRQMLLFNGFDQHPIRKDIVRLMNDLQNCEDFQIDMLPLEEVLAAAFEREDLAEYRGELNSGQSSRVHKSIYSSRADLKTLNSKAENKLIRIGEPLQAIYHQLTGHHDKEILKSLWKLMMENAAHDSIGCCNSDEVNRQIEAKYHIVHDTLNEYLDLTMRKIANLIKGDIYAVQVYNFLPYTRNEDVELEILTPYKHFALQDSEGETYPVDVVSLEEVTETVKRNDWWVNGANGSYEHPFGSEVYKAKVTATLKVRPMGYETFTVVESDKSDTVPALENEYLRISLNDNGSLSVLGKKNGYTYEKLLLIEDGADAGDSYDYSSYPHDCIYTSENCRAYDVRENANELSYSVELKVPADLEERKAGICSKTLEFCVTAKLKAHKPQVDVKVKVNNTATDHRVRLLMKTGIASEYSHADTTFGDIERPVYLPEVNDWRENKWDEKPRTIEPMQSYVYLKNNERCFGITTDCVKEYEIVGEEYDTIAYTLYRAFPYMGRSELPDRPGRASGQEELCYDDNLYKQLEFELAILIPEKAEKIVDLANEYTTPFIYYQDGIYSYTGHQFIFCRSIYEDKLGAPEAYSAFTIQGDNTKLSIYKLAEESDDTIIRVYQSGKGSFAVKCQGQISECDLNERNDQEFDENKEYVKNKIITLRKRG